MIGSAMLRGKVPSARIFDKCFEVAFVCGKRVGMVRQVRLLVVMSELDDNVIARLQAVENDLPAPFIHETFRASSINRMVGDYHCIIKKDCSTWPHPRSGSAFGSLSAIVESPIMKI
jgi:hypothetical protein